MKKIYAISMFILISSVCYSQNASTFFPPGSGYKWYYKNTPLDSLNNPQPVGATYQVDSFMTVQTYKGLVASVVVSKSGLSNINQNAPYLDTSYYNFQGTNGWSYLSVLGLIDTNVLPGIGGFLRSFDGWYNVYRFAQTVNSNYTIFSRDTTINVSGTDYPLRLAAVGRRLNDETVSTVNGNYLSKKFVTTFTISYGLIPPILYIPIASRPDTAYIAEGVWLVKGTVPSINVDLNSLGFPIAFSIPGILTELTQSATGIINHNSATADNFNLHQNYPNPFNPVTKIKFDIPQDARGETRDVRLTVYNSLGKIVATLVNEKLNAGSYDVEFNGDNFSSGVYYYKLETNSFSETKKMLLIR